MKNAMGRNRSRNASGIWNSSKEIFSTSADTKKEVLASDRHLPSPHLAPRKNHLVDCIAQTITL
jgi:hypothetical protein